MPTRMDGRDTEWEEEARIPQRIEWRAQEDLNPRTRIRSPLLYPG